MKTEKKHRGTKARVHAYKKKLAHIGTVITVAILVAIIGVSSFLLYSYLDSSPNQTNNPDQTNNPTFQLNAAIVDHLSLMAPNQSFIQKATNTLKRVGYTIDYYSGEEVTVKFYKSLPTHGYELIILRVHSAAAAYEGEEYVEAPVCIFSSEPYSTTKYVHEQLTDQLVIGSYIMSKSPDCFAITPNFVTTSMKGKFQSTTVIMMGCEGLNNNEMSEAFIQKGAQVYISWRGMVSASHTDQATTQLLKHLNTEKQTIKQAVTETMKEVGLDPACNNTLLYYPLEAGDQTIEDITGNPSTNT